jgi:hypothetical protein
MTNEMVAAVRASTNVDGLRSFRDEIDRRLAELGFEGGPKNVVAPHVESMTGPSPSPYHLDRKREEANRKYFEQERQGLAERQAQQSAEGTLEQKKRDQDLVEATQGEREARVNAAVPTPPGAHVQAQMSKDDKPSQKKQAEQEAEEDEKKADAKKHEAEAKKAEAHKAKK